MTRGKRLGNAIGTVVVLGATTVLVVVGLLNGACGSGSAGYVDDAARAGHCASSSTCYEAIGSCTGGESFSEGPCPSAWTVGVCQPASDTGQRVVAYAPWYWLWDPDCAALSGPGATFHRD